MAVPPLRAAFRGDIRLHGHQDLPISKEISSRPTLAHLWSETWAYGLAALLYPLFFQISTVLLKHRSSDAQAGVFGVALAVMTATYLIPVTVYQMFLNSKLHRWAAHDRTTFWRVYAHGNAAMLVLGILIGGAIGVFAPWFVPIAFGEAYREVARILVVLAICAPLRFLSSSVGSVLLTGKHIRYRAAAMAAAAAVAVVVNTLSIPAFGAMGAAWSTVASEAVLLLMMAFGANRLRQDDDSRQPLAPGAMT
jgi:O-antigen/teichoic acid export membrane protein